MITINIEKAKEVRRKQLRPERDRKLSALDVAFMKALEQGDTTQQEAIKAKKQALRDCMQDATINNAETIDELATARPSVLDED